MAQGERTEESGSPSRGRGGRRRRTRAGGPAPSPSMTTRSRAAQSGPRGGRKRSRDERTREDEEHAAMRTKRRNTGEQEDAAALASPATEEEASSADSSPRRRPYLPRPVEGQRSINSGLVAAYLEDREKYFTKIDRQQKLLTLDSNAPRSCLSNQELLPVRESATKIVFQAAKVVMGLSSYIDGKLLARCSGYLIEYDDETNVGKLLTSAHIICTSYPSPHDKSGMREYAPDAQVQIHLLDDTSVVGRLVNYDKNYHIALLEVDVNFSTKPLGENNEVKYSQEVFVIGRDENMDLNVSHGRIQFTGPSLYEHNHLMYVYYEVTECCSGGLVIDFDGRVVGIANPAPGPAFIPLSVIERCLRMWSKFKCIPRLHLGLKLSAIKFLDPSHVEKISRKFDIDEGFIVHEVSEGSAAEKIGIRIGDIIQYWNGKCISTTIELENMILQVCEDHLDNGNSIGSSIDVTVGIFSIRKKTHRTRTLTVNVSDDVEVVAGGTEQEQEQKNVPPD